MLKVADAGIGMEANVTVAARRASSAVIKSARFTYSMAVPHPEVKAKLKEVGLRSDGVYFFRSFLAWAVNWIVYAFITFNVIIYSGMFGPEATHDLIMSWLMGLTFAMGLIEPLNIFIVAAIPVFFSEESCCYRCYNTCFYYYNEIWG